MLRLRLLGPAPRWKAAAREAREPTAAAADRRGTAAADNRLVTAAAEDRAELQTGLAAAGATAALRLEETALLPAPPGLALTADQRTAAAPAEEKVAGTGLLRLDPVEAAAAPVALTTGRPGSAEARLAAELLAATAAVE